MIYVFIINNNYIDAYHRININVMWCRLGVVCPGIVAPRNGQLLMSMDLFHYEDVASFVCDIGYVMDGEKEIKCTSDGTWSVNEPMCKGKLV